MSGGVLGTTCDFRIEPRSAANKANPLISVLSLQPSFAVLIVAWPEVFIDNQEGKV